MTTWLGRDGGRTVWELNEIVDGCSVPRSSAVNQRPGIGWADLSDIQSHPAGQLALLHPCYSWPLASLVGGKEERDQGSCWLPPSDPGSYGLHFETWRREHATLATLATLAAFCSPCPTWPSAPCIEFMALFTTFTEAGLGRFGQGTPPNSSIMAFSAAHRPEMSLGTMSVRLEEGAN